MSDSIIVAIITGGLSLIGSVITIIISSSKTLYRISQLEVKQDKYNNLQERMAVAEKDISHIFHEIDDIRKR